jgi:Cof subfamily protein (haloacid dehalogenase superfamily)
MSKIKLVLADVDGTLVTKDKVLTERAVTAVRRLHDAGIRFALTSGRPPRGMAMLVEPLALEGPIAGFNGGAFVNPDMSVIEGHALPRDAAETALKIMLDQGLDAWVYTADAWFLRDPEAPHVARERWTVKFDPQTTADLPALLDSAVKITGCSDDLELVARCEKAVQDALGDQASAARSQPYYLDVTHRQANKGEVVRWLARRYGIAEAEIATLGDMPNDVSMFKVGGLSIAMGQAADAVKQAATHVTQSYEDEGFARGIERFILGDAP